MVLFEQQLFTVFEGFLRDRVGESVQMRLIVKALKTKLVEQLRFYDRTIVHAGAYEGLGVAQ